MKGYLTIAAGMTALALAGCGGGSKQDQAAPEVTAASSPSASTEASPAEEAGKTPVVFAQCMSCHSVKPGVNGLGPSLAGVFGRKAASEPTFAYSDALKSSGLTWNEANLDKWLTGPMVMVPGTKMTFAGQPDPAKRQELIEYLKTLK